MRNTTQASGRKDEGKVEKKKANGGYGGKVEKKKVNEKMEEKWKTEVSGEVEKMSWTHKED